MERLINLCVRHNVAVTLVAVMLMAVGLWDVRDMPLDVFPEFVPAQVSIQTEAAGFTPDQVEALVTRPVESAVNGAPGLVRMSSESIPGLSVLTLSFGDNVDPQRAHQDIAERIARVAASLPAGVDTPKLSPLVSSTMDLLKVGLVSNTLDAYDLRDLADWVMMPQLLAVPGVARVNVFGGDVRQIHILPDREKLSAYGFTLTDLADAARGALALRGGGFIDIPAQRVLIETPVPEPDLHAIAEAVVAVRGGTSVTIGDLARVEFGPALRAGDTIVQGRPGVLLSISGQFGANTMTTTRALESALRELTPSLEAQGVTVYPAMHRPANFIEHALTNLRDALGIAAVLILAVLIFFLRDGRSAFISFVTIPLSLLAAVLVMKHLGHTLNTMTIGGLAVAVGVLVDDAIIDIENIMRRLHINKTARDPRPRLAVVRDASLEIRSPVLFATLSVLMVFIPVYMTSGVQGSFLNPLALAFMLAVTASLLVALTVTPALCALMLGARDYHTGGLVSWLKRQQVRMIRLVAAHRRLAMAVLFAAFLGTLAWLPSLQGQFMPDFQEGHIVVQASSVLPGTSFEEMLGIGRRISAEMLALPYVATVEQQVGRAELGEDTWGPDRSEFHVELDPDAGVDQALAQDAIRRIVDGYPGLSTEVLTFLGDRISESLTGETAAAVINLFGDDLDTLDRTGTRIENAISGVPGLVDLNFERLGASPQILVRPDALALEEYGLTRAQVLDTLQAGYAGMTAGQSFKGTRSVDVVVLLPLAARQSVEAIGNLTVQSAAGPVPLRKLATISPAVGRSAIRHIDGQRRVVVTFNVAGRPLQDVVSEVRRRIDALGNLPDGVYVRFAGQAQAEQAARLQLTGFSVLALVLVVLILFLCFRRRAYPLLVLVNLPFSMIGSILAVGLTHIGLSLGTLVGLATVFGISSRNAILLLAHYEHLVSAENASPGLDAVLRAAAERLTPILMTALVTALGLVPLALGLGKAGYEIEGPMAITVLGGLASSTLLNLFVLPALAEPGLDTGAVAAT